jgi:hypothetical protein
MRTIRSKVIETFHRYKYIPKVFFERIYIPEVIKYNEQGQKAIKAICSLKNGKIGCRATSMY